MEYHKRLFFTPVKFADLGYNSWLTALSRKICVSS